MWDMFGKVDWFLITTNSTSTKGKAVMGRGIALEASKRFPTIAKDFATKMGPCFPATATTASGISSIASHATSMHYRPVSTIGDYDGQKIGYFMVKDHWASDAKLGIIEDSTHMLIDILHSVQELHNKDITVALNFPGIGNGRLKREDVLPIIELLPDNVQVWEYE